jgi:hypothetical protein
MARSRTVLLSRSCVEALVEGADGEPGRRLAAAIAYFLADGVSEEAGHAYPDLLREEGGEPPLHGEGDGAEPREEVELAVGEELWLRFAAEAERQRVSTDRLLEHAALFLVAQEDAGRLAERLADELPDAE